MALSKAKFTTIGDRLFKTAGDVKQSITFNLITPGVYDATTRTSTDKKTSETVDAIVISNVNDEADGSKYENTTKILMCLNNAFTNKPTVDSTVTINGITHEITGIDYDVAEVSITIYVGGKA